MGSFSDKEASLISASRDPPFCSVQHRIVVWLGQHLMHMVLVMVLHVPS